MAEGSWEAVAQQHDASYQARLQAELSTHLALAGGPEELGDAAESNDSSGHPAEAGSPALVAAVGSPEPADESSGDVRERPTPMVEQGSSGTAQTAGEAAVEVEEAAEALPAVAQPAEAVQLACAAEDAAVAAEMEHTPDEATAADSGEKMEAATDEVLAKEVAAVELAANKVVEDSMAPEAGVDVATEATADEPRSTVAQVAETAGADAWPSSDSSSGQPAADAAPAAAPVSLEAAALEMVSGALLAAAAAVLMPTWAPEEEPKEEGEQLEAVAEDGLAPAVELPHSPAAAAAAADDDEGHGDEVQPTDTDAAPLPTVDERMPEAAVACAAANAPVPAATTAIANPEGEAPATDAASWEQQLAEEAQALVTEHLLQLAAESLSGGQVGAVDSGI